MKISIGGDHAGFTYKQSIIRLLKKKGIDVIDQGPGSDKSVDYPDHVHPVCKDVLSGVAQLGILICGSGNGVAITANKYQKIRASLAWKEELASLGRRHNNANVLCLPARFISIRMARKLVVAFLEADFEGGRHKRRVDKITAC